MLAILLLTLFPAADAALKLPAKLETKRDKMVGVKAGSSAKRITWEIPAAVDFQPKPDGYSPTGETVRVEMDAGATVVFCAAPGSYRIRAFAAVAESVSFAETTLVVSDGNGPPPKPVEPVVPDPPKPPADSFQAELRALFPSPATVTHKSQSLVLSSVYNLAARESKNVENVSFAELLSVISGAINAAEGLGQTALLPIRERVKNELRKSVPDLDAELTTKYREIVSDIYGRAAAACGEMAK